MIDQRHHISATELHSAAYYNYNILTEKTKYCCTYRHAQTSCHKLNFHQNEGIASNIDIHSDKFLQFVENPTKRTKKTNERGGGVYMLLLCNNVVVIITLASNVYLSRQDFLHKLREVIVCHSQLPQIIFKDQFHATMPIGRDRKIFQQTPFSECVKKDPGSLKHASIMEYKNQ